jgi:hypothetical protein
MAGTQLVFNEGKHMATIDDVMNEDVNDRGDYSIRQQDRQYHQLVTQHNFLLQDREALKARILYLESVASHYKQFVEKIAHSQSGYIDCDIQQVAKDYIDKEPTQI